MEPHKIWQSESLAIQYLEGIRAAIPLAQEQINIMLKIIQYTLPDVKTFLDFGCGDGVLGRALLNIYPDAKGTFLDFSDYMLEAANQKLHPNEKQHDLICFDYSDKAWTGKLNGRHFDVILSGFSIHHQPDIRKKEIYKEIYEILNEGGIFLNLEHILSKSDWGNNLHHENFIDSLYSFYKNNRSDKSREYFVNEYHNREAKDSNILAPLNDQLRWLEEIGFKNVDCFFKIFELALFGGCK